MGQEAVAQPQLSQSLHETTKASLAPYPSWRNRGPKKPSRYECWPQPAHNQQSHLLRRASSTCPCPGHSAPYLPGATGPTGRSAEHAAPLHSPRQAESGGPAQGWGAELPAWLPLSEPAQECQALASPMPSTTQREDGGWTVARSPAPQPGFSLLIPDLRDLNSLLAISWAQLLLTLGNPRE